MEKEYRILGILFIQVACTAKMAEDFTKKYEVAEQETMQGNYQKKAILASEIVKRKNEGIDSVDWVNDVPMSIINEIISDFFLSFNPKLGLALKFLSELKNPDEEIKKAVLNRNNGQ